MKRDLVHFYNADVKTVYEGYLQALGNQQFRRSCREEPYHTLTFGLNFSAKYNMNGGSCTVRFISYQGGTAVNLRFSVAQLAGARYGAYDNDLTLAVEKALGLVAQNIKLNINEFLNPANKVVMAGTVYQAPVAPAASVAPAAPAPAAPASAQPAVSFCSKCGTQMREGANFCVACGAKAQPDVKKCSGCGAEAKDGDFFCAACGTKL